jgi:hypothetical protein
MQGFAKKILPERSEGGDFFQQTRRARPCISKRLFRNFLTKKLREIFYRRSQTVSGLERVKNSQTGTGGEDRLLQDAGKRLE